MADEAFGVAGSNSSGFNQKELHFATLLLRHEYLEWLCARPLESHFSTARSVCRRLTTDHHILATTLSNDTRADNFYVIYNPEQAFSTSSNLPPLKRRQVVQILDKMGCTVVEQYDSEIEEKGVPLVILESALKTALRAHLNQKGWFGVGSFMLLKSPEPCFPPASLTPTLVDAVEMVWSDLPLNYLIFSFHILFLHTRALKRM